MRRTHKHKCVSCGQQYECEGDLIAAEGANSEPKPVCAPYELYGWRRCEPCQEAYDAAN